MPRGFRVFTCVIATGIAASGCSESRVRVIEDTPGCGAANAVCDAGETPAATEAGHPEAGLVLGQCAGDRIDCTSDPRVDTYVPGPAATCQFASAGKGTVAWSASTSTIACPAPPCGLGYTVIDGAADGTLGVVGQVTTPASGSAGVWMARFSPAGVVLQESVGEFGVPSRLSDPRFFAVSGYDDQRRAFATELVGPPGEPRRTTVLRFEPTSGTATRLTTLSNIIGAAVRVAPDGGFVIDPTWWDDIPPDAQRWDFSRPDFAAQHLDLARYDAGGRLVWNQIKLTRALPLTNAGPIGFDATGTLAVALSRETGIPAQTADHSHFGLVVHQIARVDVNGNVLWVLELPPTFSVSYAAAVDGSVYVLRQPVQARDGGLYDMLPYVLDRIDPSGATAWSLEVGDSSYGYEMAGDADAGVILSTAHGGIDVPDSGVRLLRFSASGQDCATYEVPLTFCTRRVDGATSCATPVVSPGPDRSIYFSTRAAIGRVILP